MSSCRGWMPASRARTRPAKESGSNPAMFKLTIPDCDAYDNIVGTEVVNTVEITHQLITNVANGTAKPGAAFVGLQDPSLQTLALCPKYEKNTEIADLTQQTIDDINSGKIKLTENAHQPAAELRLHGRAGRVVTERRHLRLSCCRRVEAPKPTPGRHHREPRRGAHARSGSRRSEQALPWRARERQRLARRPPRGEFSACWARTAPARRR